MDRPARAGLLVAAASILFPGLAAWAYFAGYWRFNHPSLAEFPIRGVDVSHHQGKIDWPSVARERPRFAYIKASEGGDFKDPAFRRNWEEAKRNGLAVGAYHFFTFCKPGVEQAMNFLAAVPYEAEALPPVIDFEFAGNCAERPPKDAVEKELAGFAAVLRKKYGKEPLLYATNASYARYLSGRAAGRRLWMRNIFLRPGKLDGQDWTLWQYSDNSRVNGINGLVDQNVFRGSEEEFSSFSGRPSSGTGANR